MQAKRSTDFGKPSGERQSLRDRAGMWQWLVLCAFWACGKLAVAGWRLCAYALVFSRHLRRCPAQPSSCLSAPCIGFCSYIRQSWMRRLQRGQSRSA